MIGSAKETLQVRIGGILSALTFLFIFLVEPILRKQIAGISPILRYATVFPLLLGWVLVAIFTTVLLLAHWLRPRMQQAWLYSWWNVLCLLLLAASLLVPMVLLLVDALDASGARLAALQTPPNNQEHPFPFGWEPLLSP